MQIVLSLVLVMFDEFVCEGARQTLAAASLAKAAGCYAQFADRLDENG